MNMTITWISKTYLYVRQYITWSFTNTWFIHTTVFISDRNACQQHGYTVSPSVFYWQRVCWFFWWGHIRDGQPNWWKGMLYSIVKEGRKEMFYLTTHSTHVQYCDTPYNHIHLATIASLYFDSFVWRDLEFFYPNWNLEIGSYENVYL